MEKNIELINLQKSFGDHEVLRDINLCVKKGEVVSVIGSSGSGKSTMLRCINLLEEPTGGETTGNEPTGQTEPTRDENTGASVLGTPQERADAE